MTLVTSNWEDLPKVESYFLKLIFLMITGFLLVV
jgi:hypothetical protein